ncbi:AMP-binding protein [Mycobacterium sp. LTG2003]
MTECKSLGDHVHHHARTRPDQAAIRVGDQALTYQQLSEASMAIAGGLMARGVRSGQSVALVLPNCVEFVVAWLALNHIGGVAAPINTALGTEAVQRALSLCGAEVVIVDEVFLDELWPTIEHSPTVRCVVVRGGLQPRPDAIDVVGWADLAADPVPRHPVKNGDPSILLFTSGSTGRSKACVLPHRYVTRQAEIFVEQLGLTDSDILFCPFPLFHADAAIFTVAPALTLGTTAALVERFSARQFWEQIRHYGATVFDFMGATLTILFKQPHDPRDADNPARLGWGVPLPAWADEFEKRFAVELVEVYGSSDVGIVLYNRPGEPRRAGSCGRPVDSFDVKILDENGQPGGPNDVGEICIRPLEPHVVMSEYLGMPDATVQAWRDLWFHTGDLAYRDEDDYFYFVGRSKDVIRRRGENISAVAIEEKINDHPAVLEAAAFGVPSELTEDEIMVVAVPRPGHSLTAHELLAYCRQRLPRPMVPRYIEIARCLPKTPTEKVEKHVLAARGVTATTFDSTA